MSTAKYPLGMKPTPASGYNHKSSASDQYITWKGEGLSQTPVGVTAGWIRPLTNKDYGNNFSAAFGKPRPIKHYRKGVMPTVDVTELAGATSKFEETEIDRNFNRVVTSTTPGSLVKQMIDVPGGFSVKENTPGPGSTTCAGTCISANYYPNLPYLTENPEKTTQSNTFCCNEEKKARKRVRPASTNLPKNYYTTHTQYMENRCQTYKQRVFNFLGPESKSEASAAGPPGAPGQTSLYIANCYPNGEIETTSEEAIVKKVLKLFTNAGLPSPSQIVTFKELIEFISIVNPPPVKQQMIEIYDTVVLNPYTGLPPTGPTNPMSCKFVVYKPSNYQFAEEGAVSSSTLNLAKNVNTIDTNRAKLNKNELRFKNKEPACETRLFHKNGDRTTCKSLAPVNYTVY